MASRKDFVTEMTGLPVDWRAGVPGRRPQYLAAQYSLHEVVVGKDRFLGICLKEGADLRPATFEKHLPRLLASAPRGLAGYCLIAAHLPSYV